MSEGERVTVETVRAMKGRERIVSLTALDAPTASWCAEAGVDVVLVGDSLGMVSLGLEDTIDVPLEWMAVATSAARRGLDSRGAGASGRRPLLVTDLPVEGLADPVASSRKLVEAGADAVKIECHDKGMAALEAALGAGIEVMAHVGLLPQEARAMGGYKLQGRDIESARRVRDGAARSEALGAFSCVVETVPAALAAELTASLKIPTIGIGAGASCDGQILVLYDLLGVFERFKPRFARRYLQASRLSVEAIRSYAGDVRDGRFPSAEETLA
jgi:3-methyl-2-oxobutanoate hydroxymethyltransferase